MEPDAAAAINGTAELRSNGEEGLLVGSTGGEWLRSVGGVAIGLRRSVGGATRFWERRFRLRRREN